LAKQQLRALGLSRDAEMAPHSKTWREHCLRGPVSVHFGRPGSQNGNSAFTAFPRPAYHGLLYGPIESAFIKGVYLDLFAQALPTTVGK